MIKRANTPYGKKVWAGVAKVAKSCPEWMRVKISKQAKEQAELIIKGGFDEKKNTK